MDRDDLLTADGRKFVRELSALADRLDEQRLPVTSWYGALTRPDFQFSKTWLKSALRRYLGSRWRVGPTASINRGGADYQSVPDIGCDDHHPWFLYWEAYWAVTQGPPLSEELRVLDAGGTASLFSYCLASKGCEVHSVDLNQRLAACGEKTGRVMGWNLHSYVMDMCDLQFDAGSFDHAYSICVFEHLDARTRQRALGEIARVLKRGGILTLTFDFGAPGVMLSGGGRTFDYTPANLLRAADDVKRHFLNNDAFELANDVQFVDNGKRYLAWPEDPSARYTFGALFLRRL